MTEKTAFHHVALVSRRYEETCRFYQQGLGLRIKHTWGRENPDCMMDLGNGSYVEIMKETHARPLPKGCFPEIWLKSADAAGSFDRAVAAGAVPLLPPYRAAAPCAAPNPRPYRAAKVIGLEGEEIGFIQEDGAPEGSLEKLHHVTFLSNDIERAAAMYRDGFGMRAAPAAVESGRLARYVELGDNCYIKLVHQAYAAPLPRGLWAHIGLKAEDIHADFARAAAASCRPEGHVGGEPIFCDVIEAKPEPVQFWAAGVTGFDGEDITMIQFL
jgi:catechol 2,3-dioxygenase-like lactoylglutathione lyase family enzyme